MSTPLRTRLRTHLTVAMRERDRPSTNALRSVLAALDNAEAVPADSWAVAGSEHVAGAVVGVGAGVVAPRPTERHPVPVDGSWPVRGSSFS